MRVDVSRETGADLEAAIETLLAVEPDLPYAAFTALTRRPGAQAALLRSRWRHATAAGAFVARDGDGRPLALVALEARPFESAHFGLTMGKITLPLAVADEPTRESALRALYRAVVAGARADGFDHVASVASTRDRIACWTLQEAGAFHVGSRITWMAALTGDGAPAPLDAPLRLEQYDRDAIRSLPRSAWRRILAWGRDGFDRGPYVFDLDVPSDRAGAIYEVWTEKAMTGEWADTLLVVMDGDEIVAFHAILVVPDLSEALGVPVLGRGIGATLPGYRGLFTALQQACVVRRPLGAGWLEDEAQASSIGSIQVFGRMGHRCVHSVSSFHLHLGRTTRA